MKYTVKDEGDLRRYFVMIPHMIDDMKMSSSAYRLYGHLKRVAGENGECWQTTRTIAAACNMSCSTVVRTKSELIKLGLIAVKKVASGRRLDAHLITIKDVWIQNVAQYETNSAKFETNSTTNEANSSSNETNNTARVLKEEPIKNNPKRKTINNNPSTPPKNGGARSSSPEDERKYKTELALVKGIAKSIAGGRDLANWPEDVTGIVQVVCELWHVNPPTSGKSKAYWIASARELIDAAGEYGIVAIREVRADFERHMATHGGLPPFSVEGPNSLVKATRAKAGRMRELVGKDERDRARYAEWNSDDADETSDEGERSSHGDRYVSGEFAELIEH